jgi:hypothetical protein
MLIASIDDQEKDSAIDWIRCRIGLANIFDGVSKQKFVTTAEVFPRYIPDDCPVD